MEKAIDKEVFEKFFHENYCEVEYAQVREEFEQIARREEGIFTDGYSVRGLKRENFILYLTSESYCDFEAVVQETMDDLNPEILDAMLDVTSTQPDGDEVTEIYWETQRELLNGFLLRLYDEVLSRPEDRGSRNEALE